MQSKRLKGRIKECAGCAIYLLILSDGSCEAPGSMRGEEGFVLMQMLVLLGFISLIATIYRRDFWFRILLYPPVAVTGYVLQAIDIKEAYGYEWDPIAVCWSFGIHIFLYYVIILLLSQLTIGLFKEVEYRNTLRQKRKGRTVECIGCAIPLLLIAGGHVIKEEFFIMISAFCFLVMYSFTATIFRRDSWFRVLLYPPVAVAAYTVPQIANKFTYGYSWNYLISTWPIIVLIFLCFTSFVLCSQWLKSMLEGKKVISPERRSI